MRLSGNRYQDPAARLAFVDDFTDRLSHLPGVRGVSAVSFVPFGGVVAYIPIAVTGRPDLADGHVSVYTTAVTANYFDEMQMSLARGRGILPTDDGRAMPVAVVSEALARRVWPEGNAIGGQIAIHARPFGDVPRMVVGIARNIRTFGNTIRPSDQLYVPMSQEPSTFLSVIIRTVDGGGGNLATAIRHTAATVDGSQVIDSVTSLDDVVARSVAGRRSVTWLMSAFAAMAIGLAVAGLMAVIGASVAERTREIGIRMALGARSGDVLQTVLRQAVALALGGVLIGLGVAAATTRFLAGNLYGVKPLDAATFAGSAALMFGVAIAASYIPARRATRVDPLIALRAE
jgi:putative ABC transport system permease protein